MDRVVDLGVGAVVETEKVRVPLCKIIMKSNPSRHLCSGDKKLGRRVRRALRKVRLNRAMLVLEAMMALK